jgi:hypothetical protein
MKFSAPQSVLPSPAPISRWIAIGSAEVIGERVTMRITSLLTLAVVSAAILTGYAEAGQPTQAQVSAIRSACPSDYQKYCAGVPTGGQASLQCLQKNVAKLSSSCQSAVNAAGAAATPPASSDSNSTSTDQPAKTAPVTNAPITSAPAQSAPLSPRQEIFLVRNACRADFRRLCSTVPLGGGRAVQCLEANKAKLSQSCVGAIAEVRAQ